MKKCLLFLACLFVLAANGQQTDTLLPKRLLKEQLLAKSKVQKTTGWILTATGAPVFLFCLYCLIAFPADVIDKNVVTLVFAGSAVPTLAGLLLLNAGKQNKRAALSLSLRNQPVLHPLMTGLHYKRQPALCLIIPFP